MIMPAVLSLQIRPAAGLRSFTSRWATPRSPPHLRTMYTIRTPPFPELPDIEPPEPPAPLFFDFKIPPIDYQALGEHIGYTYLSRREPLIHELDQPLPRQVNGLMFGHEDQPFFALPVAVHDYQPRFVHFLYTPASPLSYMSVEACEAIFGLDIVPPVFRASIGLRMTDMRPVPEEAQFQGVNVLGSDFCLLHGATANLNYDTKKLKLTFRVEPDAKGP